MEKIWVWLKCKTIAKALEALLKAGDDEHEKARHSSGTLANEHRAEAEEFHAAKADLWAAQHNTEQSSMRNCSNDSVYGNNAPVQITRFSLPKDAREILVSAVMAVSVITSLVLWSKLHDAEKDIQTQVWLRDDALTKFEQGPFADTKAHVLALELNCKEK
jgi:hypothetical protein